jgi:hypothetical protein
VQLPPLIAVLDHLFERDALFLDATVVPFRDAEQIVAAPR